MRNSQAFTLIELLVVLVIMTVLGSFALITYISFTTKAQVQEAFQMLEEFKVQAVYAYNSTGHFSSYATLFADGSLTNCVGTCASGDTTDAKNITAKYVTQITATTGTSNGGQQYILLAATINPSSYKISANANKVFIQGIANGSENKITWQCVYGLTNSIASSLLPNACIAYLP
jgi:prepilin-type N-terminal cleavage/methylation domain-containing protein